MDSFQQPSPITFARTPTCTLHGRNVVVNRLSVNLNNDLQHIDDPGDERIMIVDREVTGTIALFSILQTQWRRVDGLPVGLDYAAVPATANLAGIALSPDRFRCLRFMEGVAAEAIRRRADARRQTSS